LAALGVVLIEAPSGVDKQLAVKQQEAAFFVLVEASRAGVSD
jgi:hypothetical protein